MAEDGAIVAGCTPPAVIALRRGPAEGAAALGGAAIGLLDAQHRVAPWRLLSETAGAAATSGDTLLERGVAALEEQRRSGVAIDPVAAGFLVYEQAKRLMARGELDQAEGLFGDAAGLAAAAGKEVSATVARGAIADILFSRGDLDAALRIRKEEELPVYERLGEVRARAVTMGKIADILRRKGDLGAARALRAECLEINRRLADADGMANTLWGLAQLDLQEQKIGDAVPRIVEAYDIVCQLGRVDAIAVIGTVLGQILAANEQPDEARIVLQRSADIYRKLGREADAMAVDEIITRLTLD